MRFLLSERSDFLLKMFWKFREHILLDDDVQMLPNMSEVFRSIFADYPVSSSWLRAQSQCVCTRFGQINNLVPRVSLSPPPRAREVKISYLSTFEWKNLKT